MEGRRRGSRNTRLRSWSNKLPRSCRQSDAPGRVASILQGMLFHFLAMGWEVCDLRQLTQMSNRSFHISSKGPGSSNRTSMPPKTPTGSAPDLFKPGENKSIVQFGWTLHMLHANTLQYAWIWNWFYAHEGSSNQNVGKYPFPSSVQTCQHMRPKPTVLLLTLNNSRLR